MGSRVVKSVRGKQAIVTKTAGGSKVTVTKRSENADQAYTKRWMSKNGIGSGNRKKANGYRTGGGF